MLVMAMPRAAVQALALLSRVDIDVGALGGTVVGAVRGVLGAGGVVMVVVRVDVWFGHRRSSRDRRLQGALGAGGINRPEAVPAEHGARGEGNGSRVVPPWMRAPCRWLKRYLVERRLTVVLLRR